MDRIRSVVLDKSKRSTLHRWMLANATEFQRLLKDVGRPEWDVLAEALGGEGLKDGFGKKPTPETARQTWWKVKKELAANPSAVKAVPQEAALTPSVRMIPVTTVKPNPPSDEPQSLSAVKKRVDDFKDTIRKATTYGGDKE